MVQLDKQSQVETSIEQEVAEVQQANEAARQLEEQRLKNRHWIVVLWDDYIGQSLFFIWLSYGLFIIFLFGIVYLLKNFIMPY